MPFNVSEFRSQMDGDGARANLFDVQFDLPAAIAGLNQGNRFAEKLTFTCRSAQLPGSTLGKIPVPFFGREVFMAGNRTFVDWTVTILNDEDFIVKSVLEQWSAAINSHVGNVRQADMVNPNSYVTDGRVIQYGKSGPDNVLHRYILQNMFPIDISPVDLDWATNDTIEEFTVTLSFDQWLSEGQNGSGVAS